MSFRLSPAHAQHLPETRTTKLSADYLRVYPARNPAVVATFVAIELSDQQIVVAAIEVEPV